MACNKIDWVCKFKLEEPKKHPNGFTLFKFTSIVLPKSYPEAGSKLVIWKRYKHFKQLYKSIKQISQRQNLPAPPSLPLSLFFRRLNNGECLEERLRSCQILLNFVACHKILFLCNDFIDFCKKGYTPVHQPSIMGQGESVSFERGDIQSQVDPNLWRWTDENRWTSDSSDDESGPASISSSPSSATSPIHNNNNTSDQSDVVCANNNPQLSSPENCSMEAFDVTGDDHGSASGVEIVSCGTEHPVCDKDMWVAIPPSLPQRTTSAVCEPLPTTQQRLAAYRVIGVIDPLLVVVHSSRPDVTLALKVHRKSCWPVDTSKAYREPRPVPNMVKLIDWIETDDAVFVITELVTQGLLIDYVKRMRNNAADTPKSKANTPRSSIRPDRHPTQYDSKEKEKSSHFGEVSKKLTSQITTESEDGNNTTGKSDADPEVDLLVQQAQRLLASVSKTLEKSAAQQVEINNFGMECRGKKPRSKSVLSRPRLERRFSSDDASGVRPRTAHASLERVTRSRAARAPEAHVRDWAAALVAALDSLHLRGVVWKDLHLDNIMWRGDDRFVLTHLHRWKGVDSRLHPLALEGLFVAPEVLGVFPVTSAADWWSLGVILYQLLTGLALVEAHPQGLGSHAVLDLPEDISIESRSLLSGLLQFEPLERLGSGPYGSEEIKCHPFFNGVDWDTAYADF